MQLLSLSVLAVLFSVVYSHCENYDTECVSRSLAKDHQSSLYFFKRMLGANKVPRNKFGRLISMLTTLIDENEDLQISSSELHSWMQQAHEELNSAKARKMFMNADSSKDGLLDWDEFSAMRVKNVDLTTKAASTTKGEILNDERALFYAADRSQDFKLSQKEFNAVLYPLRHSHMDEVIARRLSVYDTDEDGLIDAIELGELLGTMTIDVKLKRAYGDKFLRSDINSDGFLQDEELYTWLLMTDLFRYSEESFIDIFSEDNIEYMYSKRPDAQQEYKILWKNPNPGAPIDPADFSEYDKRILREHIDAVEAQYGIPDGERRVLEDKYENGYEDLRDEL